MFTIIRNIAILWILTGTLGACGPEIKMTEAIGDPMVLTETRTCSKPGLCFTCGPGFDGKLGCGLKLALFCPGNHEVTIEQTPTRITYSNGTVRETTDEKLLSRSTCS